MRKERDSEGRAVKPSLTGRGYRGAVEKKSAGRRTFGSGEVNDVTVFLEHVDFLDLRNGLHIEFLERRLQFLIVGS